MTSPKFHPSVYRSLLLAIPIAIALILLGRPLYRLSLGTPLLKAIADQDPDRVASLLQQGAFPDASDGDGTKALALALTPTRDKNFQNTLSTKRERIAELLLGAGADANETVAGAPYLFLAIDVRSLALAKDLLAHGADPNALSMGCPVLLKAIEADVGGDRAEFTQALLAAGASPHTRRSPLARVDTLSVIPMGEESPLLVAVLYTPPRVNVPHRGIDAVIEALLTGGVDVNTQDRNGQSALAMAAACGNAHVIRVLLAHGADPSLRDRQGQTALERAQKELTTVLTSAKNSAARQQKLPASARKKDHRPDTTDITKQYGAVESLLRDATSATKQ